MTKHDEHDVNMIVYGACIFIFERGHTRSRSLPNIWYGMGTYVLASLAMLLCVEK